MSVVGVDPGVRHLATVADRNGRVIEQVENPRAPDGISRDPDISTPYVLEMHAGLRALQGKNRGHIGMERPDSASVVTRPENT